MIIKQATQDAFSAQCKGEWIDNTFQPSNTTHGHRKQFWTNYNAKLVDRISEIKANQNN